MTHTKDCACAACYLMRIFGYEPIGDTMDVYDKLKAGHELTDYERGIIDGEFDGIPTGNTAEYYRGFEEGLRRAEEL